MSDTRKMTIRELLYEIGSVSYDNGDYGVIRSTKKEVEVNKFVGSYLPGTEILKDGNNGTNLIIRGKVNENKGTTGDEKICLHNYQLYDLTAQSGDWVLVTFRTKEETEAHILSTGGYLNIYCTEMIVFENGVIKPFEVLFAGDNDITLVVDKDRFDEQLDIEAMKDRISVRWVEKEEELEKELEE